MKKRTQTVVIFSAILAFTALSSCGETPKEKEEATTNKEATIQTTEEKTTEATDYSAGEKVYTTICLACHQATGEGIPGAFPPLAGSDYLTADKTRAIKQVLNGSEGEIVVNGVTFNGVMPPQKDVLNDQQIADVLNYVSHTWKNDGDTFTPEDVAAARK